jgi:predicted nucleotidyltransferase
MPVLDTYLQKIPQTYREDIENAAVLLKNEGCRAVFLFGSLVTGTYHEDSNIDIGIKGLKPEKFFRTYSKLDVSGAIKGIVNVTGLPIYNEKTRTLSINDFNLDVETQNRYGRAKNRLLKGIIMSRMRPHMKFPLGEMLDDSKTLVQKMLTDYELYEGIVLNGQIDKITVRGVEVTEAGFRAVVTATGGMGVRTGLN